MRRPGRFPRNFPEKNRPGAGAAVDARSSRIQARASVGRAGHQPPRGGATDRRTGSGAEGRPISWPDRLEDQSLLHVAEALIRFDPILVANPFTP